MNSRIPDTADNLPVLSIACGLAAGVFILDWLTPHGMAPHMLYAVAVLISVRSFRRWVVWAVAAICTVLTVGGALVSPPRTDVDIVVFNRLVSVSLIWLTAVLALLYMRTEERLRQVNLNLEELVTERTAALISAMERRERLGRDLHDDVLQLLYAAGLNLKTATPPIKNCPPDVADQIRRTVNELELAMQHLRDYIAGSHGVSGGRQPLSLALTELVKEMAVAAGPRFDLTQEFGLSVMLAPLEIESLVNVVREALSNCTRHSQAKHGHVTVGRNNGMLRIEISDDGVGFNLDDAKQGGYGLANMVARAEDMGGTLTIASSPGQGTQIVVQVPYEETVQL